MRQPGERSADQKLRQADARDFIREKLRIVSPALLPELKLYAAHPGSGIWRLTSRAENDTAPPYWAYHWPGGIALARYLLDLPQLVAGRSVLDLGAGCGIVGIAAAKSGARQVAAAEIDSNAIIALDLNAALNAVEIRPVPHDITAGPPPAVDLIAVGDLFYDKVLSDQVTAFLDRCLVAGIDVLVGDPGRVHLPRPRLRLLAEYSVLDVGQAGTGGSGAVFAFMPACDTASCR